MGTDSKTNLTPFRPKQLKSSRAAAPVRSRKFFTGGQHIVSSFSFRDLRIGARLAVGFGSLLVVMLGALLMTTVLDQRSRESLASALQVAHAKEALAAEMRAVALSQSLAIHNIALNVEVQAMQDNEARARQLGKRYDVLAAQLQKLGLAPAEKALVDEVLKADQELNQPLTEALALATSFRGEEVAKVLADSIDPLVERSNDVLERLITLQRKGNRELIAAAEAQGVRTQWVIGILGFSLLAAAAGVAYLTSRTITVPLGESVAIARRVTAGDLTGTIAPQGTDEVAQLITAMRDMNSGLGGMVRQIRAGSESIAAGASQVAIGNQHLASRTEEHASSLEETASTLEEFTGAVRRNSENANRARELAQLASERAGRGGIAVSEAARSMEDVRIASARVGELVGVIDGLAFQTNILALNAAIEAARAGEHGRGFAVVAAEVRQLAQRSADSARQVRDVIDKAVGSTDNGARLVENARLNMEELLSTATEVSQLMGDIAAAGEEQASGVEQINKAIAQMDQVVQMNASLVEEATAAAGSMASKAAELAQSVARFRTETEVRPTVEPRSAPPWSQIPALPPRARAPSFQRT